MNRIKTGLRRLSVPLVCAGGVYAAVVVAMFQRGDSTLALTIIVATITIILCAAYFVGEACFMGGD